DILEQEKMVELSQEEIKYHFDLYNRLAKKYWIPEKRSGFAWKIDAKDYNISVSEQQIAEYYEDNKTKKFVDTPIQILMQQIVQTDTTGPLADIYQDIISEKNNLWEDVAPFSRGTYDEEIERAVFSMKKGDISSVITTKGGATVVVKLIDRT